MHAARNDSGISNAQRRAETTQRYMKAPQAKNELGTTTFRPGDVTVVVFPIMDA